MWTSRADELTIVSEAWEAVLHDAEDQYSKASPEALYKWARGEQPTPAQ